MIENEGKQQMNFSAFMKMIFDGDWLLTQPKGGQSHQCAIRTLLPLQKVTIDDIQPVMMVPQVGEIEITNGREPSTDHSYTFFVVNKDTHTICVCIFK